jgi:hypothetical protein
MRSAEGGTVDAKAPDLTSPSSTPALDQLHGFRYRADPRSEASCLENCVDRFLDTSLYIVSQIEQQKQH